MYRGLWKWQRKLIEDNAPSKNVLNETFSHPETVAAPSFSKFMQFNKVERPMEANFSFS